MIRAKGQLRHHFWGVYHATIVVVFDNENDAGMALPKLGEDWKPHPSEPKALSWHGNDDAYVAVETKLMSFGADKNKIASLKFSVDVGEKFEIAIP